MTNFQQTDLNSNQLMEFGLNPNHWLVLIKTDTIASLINKKDPDLEFEISIEMNNQKPQIAEIRFVI